MTKVYLPGAYPVWKKLEHGMYLDAKSVLDDAMPTLREGLFDLVPLKLHQDLDEVLAKFEDELVECEYKPFWTERVR